MAEDPSVTQQAQGSYIAQASQGGTATIQVFPAPMSQEQNRVRFLARLRYQYQELWEQSLQGAALMDLGLASKPEAVQHQTELLFLPAQQPERLLPPGTSIAQVYEEAGQELLILGEPGAGKSMLLLDLARYLMGRAEQDAQQPMPVILPLSTWAVKRQPLSDWLTEQVSRLYQVPTRLSSRWMLTDQVLPLLDGLDEVPQEKRLACIAAITTYHGDHLVPLVVCSRRAEYEELAKQQRFMLHSAVVVQPLTSQQVDDYLIKAGEPLAALRTVLQTNSVLQDLTSTPLMLSVLSLTYKDATEQDLPSMGNTQEQQRIVFTRYIEHMVERRRRYISFSLQQAIHWLSWLADQMKQRNQTVFYLEQLQADWLPLGWLRHLYKLFAVNLAGVVIGMLVSLLVLSFFGALVPIAVVIWTGLLGGLIGGLVSGVEIDSSQFNSLVDNWKHRWPCLLGIHLGVGLLLGVSTGLVFALAPDSAVIFADPLRAAIAFGIGTGLSSLLLSIVIEAGKKFFFQKILSFRMSSRWSFRFPFPLVNYLSFGVVIGILLGISGGLSLGLSGEMNNGLSGGVNLGPSFMLFSPLFNRLFFGLIFGMTFGFVGFLLALPQMKRKKIIEPAEIIIWSVKQLGRNLITRHHLSQTLRIAFLFGILTGLGTLTSGDLFSGLSSGLSLGLCLGLSYWVFIGFWNSLSRETLDNNRRIRPNEGMRRSGRNGLLVGLITGGLGGLLNALQTILFSEIYIVLDYGLHQWLSLGVSVWSSIGLSVSPLVGLVAGFLAALLVGWLAWLQHYLLRGLLWRAGVLPWRYISFLDDAAGCILLRKVGGGYSFVHRLILDYFASLNKDL